MEGRTGGGRGEIKSQIKKLGETRKNEFGRAGRWWRRRRRRWWKKKKERREKQRRKKGTGE